MQPMKNTAAQPMANIQFRPLALGDAGWIIHRHGVAIAPEFGWGMGFEAMCAQILADFITNFDPASEQSWIATRGDEILGSLFLVRADATTAKLRLLYVEKASRGLGLATQLLQRAIAFAREKGYATITLYTTSSNVGARRIYQKLGMELVREEAEELFGQSLTGEYWQLSL